MEWGGSSERCLKWGGGGSLRDLSKNILKQGVGKAKVVRRGEGGFEGVTTPAPPENFNHTLGTPFTTRVLLFFLNLVGFGKTDL